MIETLRRLPGFDSLADSALEVILERSPVRRFAPGQLVLAGGSIANVLLGCLEGELVGASGARARQVFDAPGLFYGLAANEDYHAGPEGLAALVVAKPHAFTIVREFPEFVVSLLIDLRNRT